MSGTSPKTKKAHVKVDEWQSGGFHVERHVKCRCGWTFTHYNREFVNEKFKEHVAASGESGSETE